MQNIQNYESNLCSLDPTESWYVSDVTIDSTCICPEGQSQVSKLLGEKNIYKCQLDEDNNNPDVLVDQIDASSSRNLSNINNPNNYNNPLTRNDPSKQMNLFNSVTQNTNITQPQPNSNAYLNMNNPNPSFNTEICSETPYTNKPSDWVGLSTDSTCNCPFPLTQVKTEIDNNNYFTCSWPSNK
jgi:hypothetical protein